jgi:hypothetical protein
MVLTQGREHPGASSSSLQGPQTPSPDTVLPGTDRSTGAWFVLRGGVDAGVCKILEGKTVPDGPTGQGCSQDTAWMDGSFSCPVTCGHLSTL